MKRAWAVTVLVCVAFVGCGGDDDDDAAAPANTQTAETTATTADSGGGASAGGGRTAPGTTLKVGETANATYKPLTALDDKNLFDVAVTAEKIEKGSIDDFKNIDLDEDQKASTPYYVTVKIENTGKEIPLGDQEGDPDIKFGAIDDRGQEQPSITFIGNFDRCEDTDAPKPFAKGKSYESCLTYLVGGDGSITKVQWKGSDKYILDPVEWK
ncbi:MAG TPA: hypothetical protein VF072_00450 [Thermoleophilaceae bacterium]